MTDGLRARIRDLTPRRSDVKSDVVAGLTFAIVSVPQAMAHALLAAVNPVLGIYTLMIAVPVAAIFTSSVFMNVSTTAALSVVVGAELADVAPENRVQSLAALVVLVGLFQFAAGLLRLGFVLRFVSNAVMTGFLNAVAVLIVLGQLGALTGYDSPFTNSVARALDLFLRIGQIDAATTLIGGLTLALIVGLLGTRWSKFAFVLAIAAATLLLWLLSGTNFVPGADWDAVAIVRHIAVIPRDAPQLVLPMPGDLFAMLVPALSVAVIGLVQGAGVGQAYPNPDGKYPTSPATFSARASATSSRAWSPACRPAARFREPYSSWGLGRGRAGPTFLAASGSPSWCCWRPRWPNGCPCRPLPRC